MSFLRAGAGDDPPGWWPACNRRYDDCCKDSRQRRYATPAITRCAVTPAACTVRSLCEGPRTWSSSDPSSQNSTRTAGSSSRISFGGGFPGFAAIQSLSRFARRITLTGDQQLGRNTSCGARPAISQDRAQPLPRSELPALTTSKVDLCIQLMVTVGLVVSGQAVLASPMLQNPAEALLSRQQSRAPVVRCPC